MESEENENKIAIQKVEAFKKDISNLNMVLLYLINVIFFLYHIKILNLKKLMIEYLSY